MAETHSGTRTQEGSYLQAMSEQHRAKGAFELRHDRVEIFLVLLLVPQHSVVTGCHQHGDGMIRKVHGQASRGLCCQCLGYSCQLQATYMLGEYRRCARMRATVIVAIRRLCCGSTTGLGACMQCEVDRLVLRLARHNTVRVRRISAVHVISRRRLHTEVKWFIGVTIFRQHVRHHYWWCHHTNTGAPK